MMKADTNCTENNTKLSELPPGLVVRETSDAANAQRSDRGGTGRREAARGSHGRACTVSRGRVYSLLQCRLTTQRKWMILNIM